MTRLFHVGDRVQYTPEHTAQFTVQEPAILEQQGTIVALGITKVSVEWDLQKYRAWVDRAKLRVVGREGRQ